MKQDLFEVENVERNYNGVTIRIIVNRRFQPPVTLVFSKKWGEKELALQRQENRADGAGINAPPISEEWVGYAKILATVVAGSREEKNKKDIFWATQPRLFD